MIGRFGIVFLSLLCLSSFQRPASGTADEFLVMLFAGDSSITRFVAREQLRQSDRLGITYEGVPNKWLIGSDIDREVKENVARGMLSYVARVEPLDAGYERLVVEIGARSLRKEFYFRGDSLVSAPAYFARSWKAIESKHFKIITPDTALTNRVAMERLEIFLDTVSRLLDIPQRGLALLERQKIVYYLCETEQQIEDLTGFRTLGMYVLAYDYVVSTFNCHYHELLHLLVNFKLRHLPLFTHPFLQEGIAVALGGRGGKEPPVILEVGKFLMESDMGEVGPLLTRKGFLNVDASLSYPLSGLYNAFLLNELSASQYLTLYRKYSTPGPGLGSIDTADLPASDRWHRFLRGYPNTIRIDDNDEVGRLALESNRGSITTVGDRYHLEVQDTLLLTPRHPVRGYRSARFAEVFPRRKYSGERFLILVNRKEASIYDLYTNNLIASHASALSYPSSEIRQSNGRYVFSVDRDVFDIDLSECTLE